jgi:cell division protein FtsQ
MSKSDPAIRRGLPPAAGNLPFPADKRFRRSDHRQGRRRNWRRLIVRAAGFGGASLAVLIVVVWIGHALVNAAVLRIDHVVVRGNARLGGDEVDTRLEGLRGQSILRVDLEQYRLRLLETPWVESAELWRVLPSTVQVRIVERTPLAVARLRGQLFLVDAAGFIIDSFGPRYGDLDLPVVDGLLTHTASGPTTDAARIALVQRVFREVSARPELFRRMSQLDVSNPHNAVVLLKGEPAELRLGDRDFLKRLQQYEETVPRLKEQRAVLEYYDLRFGDRMWVK